MSRQVEPAVDPNKPLEDLDHWEDFLKARYPEPQAEGFKPARDAAEFRDYRTEARPSV
jgi:hypothetical protein